MSNKKIRISITPREQAVGWFYLVFALLFLPPILSLIRDYLPFTLSTAVLNFAYFLINFVAVILIFRRLLGKSLENAGKKFWNFVQAVILGFVAYYLCSEGLTRLIQWLYPSFSNINDGSIASMAGTNFQLIAIGTVILVPVAEECLHRGLVFLGLRGKNRVLAYTASILFFAGVHVFSYIGSAEPLILVLCFIQYIPAGFWLAWALEKADSLFAPILIHCAVNAIAVYALR